VQRPATRQAVHLALLDERVHLQRPSIVAMRSSSCAAFFTSGPATPHDFAKWSGLTLADARQGLEGAGRALACDAIDGGRTGSRLARQGRHRRARRPRICCRSTREHISATKDRARSLRPHTRRGSGRWAALTAIVIVDGRVVGTWKRRVEKRPWS
jgi:hypothetical protein